VSCDTIGVLTTGIDPTLIDELLVVWYGVVGLCHPYDELISLVGTVVVAVGSGEQRASKNSVTKLKYIMYALT